MTDQSAVPVRRMSAEFVGIYAIGVTLLLAVFSQFAWLDGKFERLEARFEARFERLDVKIDELGAELRADIRDLRRGQASLDKRLAVVESHVLGLPPVSPTETRSEPAS